jgi:choice-of-anchor A domain-containing protein
VTCAGNCSNNIATAVSQNPGRVIWVQGSATIESAQVWGTLAQPVMLVVQGDLTVADNLQLFGVLYLGGSATNTWTTTAGGTLIEGAVVGEGNLSVVGTPTIVFNPAVLRTINLTQGSLVRIPGSWRDFQAGS